MPSFLRRPAVPWHRHPLKVGVGLAAVLALGLGTGLMLVHPRLALAANTTDKTCTSASYAHDITTAGTKGIITFDCPSPADIDVRTGAGGPGTVTVATGSTLSLTDIGASITLDGEHAVQLFVVNGGGSLTLDHLIVADGQTGSDGGGILNDDGGALTITDSTFSGDSAACTLVNNFNGFLSGGDCFGGGLANFGTATITNSTFSGDSADGTLVVNPNGFATGGSGEGGGLYNRGTATISGSTFSGDSAAGGAALASGSIGTTTTAEGGDSGGGGLENEGGTATISGSTFSGDSATGGGGIGGVATAGFGGTGSGGGLSNVGTLTISGSTFSGDSAAGGGGANTDSTSYGDGGDGFGGALFTAGTTTTATISGSTFSGDSATGGGGIGAAGTGGDGSGGALNNGGTLTITNATLTGNSATGGGGSGAGTGGNGHGGALINSFSATITNATLTGNSATGGAPGGSGFGGALEGSSNTITVTNSIVAASTASSTPGPNCFQGGTVTDGGNNLEDGSSPTDCGFSAANQDQFALTPSQLGLGGLGNHGGPTQTMALAPGSLALGHANLVVCTNTTGPNPVNGVDQRGVHRPQGTGCDIGAFELERPIILLRVAGPIFVAPGVPNIRYVSGDTIFILTAATSGDGVAPAAASYCVAPVVVGDTCSNFTTVQAESLPATFSLAGGDGPYTVSAYASDSFGDRGAIQAAAYTLDTTPPATTLTIGQPQTTVGGQVEVSSRTPLTLRARDAGSGMASVSYRFFREGRRAPAFTVVRGTTARFKLTGADGVYEVDYLATDHVGNIRSYSVTLVLANGQLHVATQP